MKYTEKNDLRILISDFGYLIHNKNSDTYSKKVYLGKNASLDDFEEVRDEDVKDFLLNKINELDEENIMQYEIMDATMLVLDGVFNCIESISPSAITTSADNEEPNQIVNFYAIMVQRGLKDLDDIPDKYKEQIIKILNK